MQGSSVSLGNYLGVTGKSKAGITKLNSVKPNTDFHCVTSVRIRNFSGPYSECGKKTDQKNSEFGHFWHFSAL